MRWIALAVGTVCFIELFQRLDLTGHLTRMATCGRKAAATLRSRAISDHWKERALLAYSRRILGSTLAVLVLMLLCVAPLLALSAVVAFSLSDPGVWRSLGSLPGLLLATLTAVIYLSGKKRLVGR